MKKQKKDLPIEHRVEILERQIRRLYVKLCDMDLDIEGLQLYVKGLMEREGEWLNDIREINREIGRDKRGT